MALLSDTNLHNWTQSFFRRPQGCVIFVTHVPRTSLKSNIFLISSTCFFQDPSLDSPFSFAISHRGWGEEKKSERERETLPEDHQPSHPAQKEEKKGRKKKDRKKSNALLYFAKGFLAFCQHSLSCLLSPCMQPGKPKAGGDCIGRGGGGVCPTPRGYFTNLFDVADPKLELPQCSDHCDGETQALPLLLLGRDSASVMRRCWELRTGCSREDDTWQSHPSCCAIESHRPPCGCYSNRRSGRLLLPPIYLTAQAAI